MSGGSSPSSLFSLLVSYVIVFESSLGDQDGRRETGGVLQSPLEETVASYVVALLVPRA